MGDTGRYWAILRDTARHCATLRDTARHCATLRDTARHCATLRDTAIESFHRSRKAYNYNNKVRPLKKTLRADLFLSCLGDIHASLPDVTNQATEFVGACYGHKHHTSMSEARKMPWAAKVGNGSRSTPHLNNLPPLNEHTFRLVYGNMHNIQHHY